jgi:hypothetical protein
MEKINKLLSKRETFIIIGSLIALEVIKQNSSSRKFLTITFKRGGQHTTSIGPIDHNAGSIDQSGPNLENYNKIQKLVFEHC